MVKHTQVGWKEKRHFWPWNRLSGFWFHCLAIHQAYCQFVRIVRHFRFNKMNSVEVRRSKKAWCDFRLLIIMWWVSRGEVTQFTWSYPLKFKRLLSKKLKWQTYRWFAWKAHRGTRWHSMQSFGGPSHSKITWVGTGLIEGYNRKKCILVICSLKWSAYWLGFRLIKLHQVCQRL